MNTTDGKTKSVDDIKFETRIEREMKLVDKRVAKLQEMLNNTISIH